MKPSPAKRGREGTHAEHGEGGGGRGGMAAGYWNDTLPVSPGCGGSPVTFAFT